MDLLEDARDGADEGGADGGEVLDQLLQPAIDGGGEADAELRRPDHLPEDVSQRQPEELQRLRVIEDARRVDRLRLRHPAGVGELDALRPAGGARGVDERGERLGGHRLGRLLEAARRGRRVGAPERLQRREREGEAVVLHRAVQDDRAAERGELGATARQLREVAQVLDEGERAPGVGEDEDALVAGAGGIEGGGGPARAEDGEIAEEPLEAGGGEDGAALLGGEAERAEPARDGAHAALGVAPGEALPAPRRRMPEGLRLRRPPDAVQEQRSHRARSAGARGLRPLDRNIVRHKR